MAADKRIHITRTNPTRLWGLIAADRIARIARTRGLTEEDAAAAALFADDAFAFDPAWLDHVARRPGSALVRDGRVVLAHAADPAQAAAVRAAIDGQTLPDAAMTMIDAARAGAIENEALRKRETPFVLRLDPDRVAAAERASYQGAYKGVTDLLTKYLWPQWAFALTRLAARLGLSPNTVTSIGLVFCIAAGWLFYQGDYGLGLAAGLVSMVLDTVDGKLARCTITSSRWGNIYDHGIDLIHPPLWWWAWGEGLARSATPLPPATMHVALAAILAAYVVQRLIEGAFIAGFGMHIHVWRRFDSAFRLVTARRNPNWLILLGATIAARPDLGFLAVAWWGVTCCLVHAIRLGQAWLARWRGRPVVSWLSG